MIKLALQIKIMLKFKNKINYHVFFFLNMPRQIAIACVHWKIQY